MIYELLNIDSTSLLMIALIAVIALCLFLIILTSSLIGDPYEEEMTKEEERIMDELKDLERKTRHD